MNASRAERPRAREDVVFRQLDEEWVVFDPARDKLHALNLTAALVWSHLSGELSVAEIAQEIAGAFDPAQSGEAIVGDVARAVQRFRDEGLLR